MLDGVQTTIDNVFNAHRKDIKLCAAGVKETIDQMKRWPKAEGPTKMDVGEMIANCVLAYRHLEDASQRLGKAIQAYDGGKSVYDKETTVGV